MKNISEELKSAFSSTPIHVAYCAKITTRNGFVYALTSHDEDLSIPHESGIYSGIYATTVGSDFASVELSANSERANLSINGAFDAYGYSFTKQDLISGLLDHARIIIFQVDYTDLDLGYLECVSGYLGDMTIKGNTFSFDIIGDASLLDRTLGVTYESACPVLFGSVKCGLTLSEYTSIGHVTSVITNGSQFHVSIDTLGVHASINNDYYSKGLLNWTGSGVSDHLNTGLSFQVDSYTNIVNVLTITLLTNTPYTITVGDTFTITAGCKKRFVEDCTSKFNNASHFQGFPYIPTADQMKASYTTKQAYVKQ